MLTDAYAGIARESRAEGDQLSDADLGALLTALEQGAALLTLTGSFTVGQRLLATGMQRLLDPLRATEPEDVDADADDGEGALHHRVVRQRVAESIREQRGTSPAHPAAPSG